MKALALLLIPAIIFLCSSAVFYLVDRMARKKELAWWEVPAALSLIFPAAAGCLVAIIGIITWVVT